MESREGLWRYRTTAYSLFPFLPESWHTVMRSSGHEQFQGASTGSRTQMPRTGKLPVGCWRFLWGLRAHSFPPWAEVRFSRAVISPHCRKHAWELSPCLTTWGDLSGLEPQLAFRVWELAAKWKTVETTTGQSSSLPHGWILMALPLSWGWELLKEVASSHFIN